MLREIAVVVGVALAVVAHAQEKKPSAQQARMAECNKKASGMKGEERKKFMSECLRDRPQDRMAKCNKEAGSKALKGEERKKFMSECLKAS